MGDLAYAKSQDMRSSGSVGAARWKQDNARTIGLFALGTGLGIVLFMLMLYGTSTKQVTLVVNGEERTVTTRQWRIDALLAEQNVVIGPNDRLDIPEHGKLAHGDRIEIQHTQAIRLIADGRKTIVHTVGKTVGEAIEDLNIPIDADDRVFPSPETPIKPGDMIRIVRVDRVIEQVERGLPFDVVQQPDNTLLQGKQKVIREGKEGVLVELHEKVFEDGALKSSRVVDTVLSAASVDKVVAVGNRKPVTVLSASSPNIDTITKKGVTFNVKQILSGVQLTAYDAGPASTGKDVGHPQYGITYTGTKVKEGRTIAVDPKVIPLGWWVYIEGYGFRRAEDIGSAVKGKIIDIYFDDASKSGLGRKKGVTVYVIGPNKPDID